MHSSAACASSALSTANKSSYSAIGTLHAYHISPLAHQSLRSLSIAFMLTLTLLTIPLQPPANRPILQAWM